MNKTKLYCHLGGIAAVAIFLVMVAIGTFVPTKYLLWSVSIAAIVAFFGGGGQFIWQDIITSGKR